MAAIPDTHQDLLDARTGILATLGPDGRPQLSAVWFLAENGTIRLSLNTKRQKVKNLREDPSVTFFILDFAAATRYLEVRGDAELADDPDEAFAAVVGQKYGVDLKTFDSPGDQRIVVTIHPVRVNAVDILAGG